jgi:hypothetical protein
MLRERDDTHSLPAAAAAEKDVRILTAPPSTALRALGSIGLLAVLAGSFAVAAGASGAPGPLVPARSGGWPGWLSGPLHGLGLQIGWDGFQAWTLLMCAGYGAVLAAARSLPGRAIAAALLASTAILLVGPPLISQDAFGYLAFARLGVLHGLNPYTHVAAEAPIDATFPFVGWPFQHSPYGPLFTLGTYPLAKLGLAGGLWALKAIAAAASLGAVALVALAARRMGRSGAFAAAFVGLNPVLLLLAVGGAHNDTLVLLALASALALAARPERLRAAVVALVAGIGVKASAGLVLPYLLLSPRAGGRARLRLALAALASLALLAAIAMLGFGVHALGFADALGEQQQLVATHSVPQETARWLGMSGLPAWWRDLFTVAFAAVLALTLWLTARGADWRTMAGWAMLALLLCTAWLLPWYATWALPLAALGDSRRLRVATLAVCAYALLIHLPLADPVLSPPRHVIAADVPTRVVPGSSLPSPAPGLPHAGAGTRGSVATLTAARLGTPLSHHAVFAGLQVGGHAALDLRR